MRDYPELPLEPQEPKTIGCCCYCGDEIYQGNAVYEGEEGMAHKECILSLMIEKLGANYIAEMCGYREVVA